MATEKEPPQINVRFVYHYCPQIEPMRVFYSDVLGMQELTCVDNEKMGWAVYQCDGFQLMFMRDAEAQVDKRWGYLPGDGSGDAPIAGCSIHVPEEMFADVIARVIESGAPSHTPVPTWRQNSYWGLSIKDPMGFTIEVYTSPKETPAGDLPIWAA